MRDDTLTLRPVLAIAGLLAAALLLIWAAVALDRADLLIPPPEQTAEQLVGALAAHRYEGAMNQLSQDLRQQVSQEELQSLVQAIEKNQNGILQATGLSAQEQGQDATASVEVKLGTLQEQVLDFPLKKEKGLWKVSSIEPIRNLSASSHRSSPAFHQREGMFSKEG